MKLQKIYQLFLTLSGLVILLWFVWFNRNINRLYSSPRQLEEAIDKDLLFRMSQSDSDTHQIEHNVDKRHSVESAPSTNQASLVELPADLNVPVDLTRWEMFPEDTNHDENEANDVNINGDAARPGLGFRQKMFYLNGMKFRIFSGAIHYFRIVPEYWLDRLKKMKACGLNTIETYIPWNMHEPSPGVYNFDGILDLRKFLTLASEMGFYVIIRPGPYICSELEFGGLPGWLMADPTMSVRTNHLGYVTSVNKYLSVLLPKLLDLQFSEGGPIIIFQVENEYASFARDSHHVRLLYYLFRKYGVKEMIVTSDNGQVKHLADQKEFDISKYALSTMNGDSIDTEHVELIQKQNKHAPIMVMELWCGWFDQYKTKHSVTELSVLNDTLQYLFKNGGSFNLYMFIGGTNFGFTNGANNFSHYSPIVTSYDYDAILTEAGDTTPKYHFVRGLLLKFYRTLGIPYLPQVPLNTVKASYGNVRVAEILTWNALMKTVPMIHQDRAPDYMETYKDGEGKVHTLGYIVYSHVIRNRATLERKPGPHSSGFVNGRLMAMVDGEIFYMGTDYGTPLDELYVWDKPISSEEVTENLHEYIATEEDIENEPQWLHPYYQKIMSLSTDKKRKKKPKTVFVDFMVENQGRINFVTQKSQQLDQQRKGMKGPILEEAFGIKDEEWSVRILHFDKQQCQLISQSKGWQTMKAYRRLLEDREETDTVGPKLYKLYLDITGDPQDTFIKLKHWKKGVVIVNNFNLGRYWEVGPQQTLYLPGPLLKSGRNEIMVFEEQTAGEFVTFQDKPEWGLGEPT